MAKNDEFKILGGGQTFRKLPSDVDHDKLVKKADIRADQLNAFFAEATRGESIVLADSDTGNTVDTRFTGKSTKFDRGWLTDRAGRPVWPRLPGITLGVTKYDYGSTSTSNDVPDRSVSRGSQFSPSDQDDIKPYEDAVPGFIQIYGNVHADVSKGQPYLQQFMRIQDLDCDSDKDGDRGFGFMHTARDPNIQANSKAYRNWLPNRDGELVVEGDLKGLCRLKIEGHNKYDTTFEDLKNILCSNAYVKVELYYSEPYDPSNTKLKGNSWKSDALVLAEYLSFTSGTDVYLGYFSSSGSFRVDSLSNLWNNVGYTFYVTTCEAV